MAIACFRPKAATGDFKKQTLNDGVELYVAPNDLLSRMALTRVACCAKTPTEHSRRSDYKTRQRLNSTFTSDMFHSFATLLLWCTSSHGYKQPLPREIIKGRRTVVIEHTRFVCSSHPINPRRSQPRSLIFECC